MSCASCVSRVEKALAQVDGVHQARVNLAERSALVIGSPQPEALVSAVVNAGYGAEVIGDESERREKQQLSARRAMRRFSWQSALALALGVPLMVYGLFGDNMMLTASNRSGWLVIGVLTLLVMVVAGGHFIAAHGAACAMAQPQWIRWWRSARSPPGSIPSASICGPTFSSRRAPSLL